MFGYCLVISGHVWLLSGESWPFLPTVRRILAVFGDCVLILGHVCLLSGGFWPCLVIVW